MKVVKIMIRENDPEPQPVFPLNLVFQDAAADFRTASGDAIESFLESASHVLNDPDADPVERHLAAERTRSAETELKHRRMVARLRSGTATKYDRSREAWSALARLVRERVEVPDILILAGVPMVMTGTSRGRHEWHGPCPLCRDGQDRLIAWSGPSGRCWCRRCGWSGDAIAAASLIVGTGQFREIVAWLAEHAGLAVPDGR